MNRFILSTFAFLLYTGITFAQQFTINGNAVQQSCECYQLTQNVGGQGGSAWNNNQINLNNSFDYNFRVFLGCSDDPGADGIVFVLQNTNTGVSTSGGGLGYQGFPNQSIGIELDTYENGNFGDPSFDHIALNSNGNISHDLVAPIQASASSSNIEDCVYHDFRVVWNAGTQTLTVYFDGVIRFTYTFAGGIVNTIFAGNPNVYWGFTGATGGQSNDQRFCVDFDAEFGAGTNYTQCGGANIPFTSFSQSGLNSIVGYSWNFGDGNTSTAQNPTHTYSLPGVYNVSLTITDQSLCTNTQTHQVIIYEIPTITPSQTNVSCFGGNNGTITANVNGGIGPYTIYWTQPPATISPNGPNTFTGINFTAGTYTVYATDFNGCSTSQPYTITQPATPLAATSSHTDVTCPGLNNGTITVTVSGGTPPYSFLGNPLPAGTTVIPNLAPATYAGAVTDANGCTVNLSETITQPGPQSLTLSNTNNVCNGGNTATATANFVNATGGVTYAWSNGASGANISGLTANTYTITATDANLCSLTGSITVTEPAAVTMNVSTTNATCFGTNGSATANPSGGTGAYSYVWSAGGGTTQTVSLPAGNYSVTAADANGCNQTATFTITEPTDITIQETHTDVLCFGNNTGDITLNVSGGAGPNYTYNWNPNVSNTNTAALLTAGTYTITVTDQSNCNKSISVVIDQPAQALAINIQSNNITCFGQTNGSITITPSGGTPGYTYTWNPNVGSGNTATNLSAGTYNITVTDLNNCTIAPNVVISEPSQPLTLTPSSTNLSCFQSNNGTASVAVTGGTFPYNYQWTGNVSNTNTATSLAAGNYTVTVTDNNGCTNTNTFLLTQPTLLTAAEIHTDVLCFGDTTGTVTITANGGTPGYTYAWTPGISNTNAATGLGAGNYTVLVTDTNNCTVSITATVAQPTLLTLTATATNVLCNGGSDGTITATSAGGTPAYTYSITQDGTNFVNEPSGLFTGLLPGTYTAIAADLNGCTATQLVTITEPLPLTVTTTVTNASCYRFSDGVVTVTPAGGVPGYTFNSDSAGNSVNGTYTGLSAGNYSFTVTDNNGCSVTETAIVTEPDSVIVTVSPTPTEVKLGSTLQINTLTNQSGNVTYSWTPNFGLSCYDCADPVFEGIYSQPYNLIVTNANGCTGSSQFLVTVIPNYDVFFPNAFTPNSDGANDEWQVYGNLTAIKQFNVKVFNRIGEKVYESNDVNYRWDGTYKDAPGVPGVYVYHATIVWLNNHSDAKYIGSVTLMR